MTQITSGEKVLDMANGGAFVSKATDPVVTNVGTPIDFAAQYPTPLDPTEVITMCEEINLLNSIPEYPTGLKEEIWRELNVLSLRNAPLGTGANGCIIATGGIT